MTSVSKNGYINNLDDIVGWYNNAYHRTIKMKLVDVKYNSYIDFFKKVNDRDTKFKVGHHLEFLKRKIFLLKDTHQTGLKNFLLLVKLKMQFHGHILLTILMVKKLLEHFMKKNYKRLINNNLG